MRFEKLFGQIVLSLRRCVIIANRYECKFIVVVCYYQPRRSMGWSGMTWPMPVVVERRPIPSKRETVRATAALRLVARIRNNRTLHLGTRAIGDRIRTPRNICCRLSPHMQSGRERCMLPPGGPTTTNPFWASIALRLPTNRPSQQHPAPSSRTATRETDPVSDQPAVCRR